MFGQGFNSGFFAGPNYIYKEDIFGDNSCIGLYTMDYDFSDSSGNDNDMGVFGSPDHGVSGGLNLGARFDGYNTSARAYPVSDLQGLTSVSISFWFKWDDSASVSDYGHMVNIGDMSGVSNGDAFGIAVGDDGGSYNRVLYGYFPEGSLSTGQIVTDNVWHHVLMTYSGTTVKYYYDGNSTPIATQTRTSLSLQNSAVNRITVGHYAYNGNHHFKGDLDHLRVFNREIQSSELATLYNEKFYSLEATTTNIDYPVANLAYYKLDNNSKALGPNATGKFNQGATIVGNSTGIENSTLQLSSTAHSVSLWMKPQDLTASKWHIVFGSYFSGGPTFTLGKRPDQTTSFHYRNESSNEVYFTLSTANIWYHIVVTRNNSGSTVYVNGSSVATDSNSMGSYSYSGYQKCVIGSMPNYPVEYFSGTIDQVRVYNVVLTATDVANLYNNETVSTANSLSFPTGKTAIATYKLDGDGVDISGNYSGVGDSNVKYDYSGTDTNIEYRFGRFGQAAVFNGSNSKIDTGISSISSPFSVSMWINEDSLDSGMFFANWNSTSADMYWQTTSDGKLRISIDGFSQQFFGTAGDVTAKTWHHIAVALGSGVYEVYLDGTSLGTSTTSVTTFSSGQNFMLGNSAKASTPAPFDGKIDQVRIFSTALDSSQVTQLYNEKPEVDTSNFKAVLYKGNGATRYISSVGFEPSLTWFKARTVANYDNGLFDVLRGDGENYISSNLSSEERIPSSISNYGYVSLYDVNGVFLGQGGNSNHPWAVNNKSNVDYVAWNWKGGGLLNRSASFNGSNSKIDLPNVLSGFTNTYSFSIWVKIDNVNNFPFFGSDPTSTAATNIIRFALHQNGNYYFDFGNNSTARMSASTPSEWRDNTWHHFVFVSTSTQKLVYVDGSLFNTISSTTAISGKSNLTVGHYLTNYGGGLYDQVRVFNRGISSSEVTSLYNETSSTINTLQVLGDTSCIATYPLGVGAGDVGNTYSGTPTNVTFNNPGHLTRNTNGTIKSAVSANQDAGFSIVKYTGNNSSSATVGHGLTNAEMIVLKDLTDGTNNWRVWHKDLTSGNWLYLNLTNAQASAATDGGLRNVDSNTFGFVNGTTAGVEGVNSSASNYIAYCWRSVSGFSKIGSYSGSGASGKEVALDFSPSFVMIKRINAATGWVIVDNQRGSKELYAHVANAEDTSTTNIVLGTNKFTLNSTGSWYNASGGTYLYMAFK